ncbi:MAG: hypothetical protein R6U27_16790 [Desulfobacterales bacterium]
MTHTVEDRNALIEKTISQRTGCGPNERVKAWQSMLGKLLEQLSSYLQPSRIVTFRHLSPAEKQIFQKIVEKVELPKNVCGIYLSPSVRNQILYTNQGLEISDDAAMPKDDGVLLFSRPASHITIINVLLAYSPYTPAIDVYDHDALLAGYVYNSIDDCMSAISEVTRTYFGKS